MAPFCDIHLHQPESTQEAENKLGNSERVDLIDPGEKVLGELEKVKRYCDPESHNCRKKLQPQSVDVITVWGTLASATLRVTHRVLRPPRGHRAWWDAAGVGGCLGGDTNQDHRSGLSCDIWICARTLGPTAVSRRVLPSVIGRILLPKISSFWCQVCESVTSHGERDFADIANVTNQLTLGQGAYPGLPDTDRV